MPPTPRGTLAPLKKLISERELAKMLGVSLRHVGNLRERRVIPFIRLGRSVRFNPDEISQVLNRLTVRPPEVQA